MTFKVIIVKVNKFTIHGRLWLNDSVKLFVLSIYNHFLSLYIYMCVQRNDIIYWEKVLGEVYLSIHPHCYPKLWIMLKLLINYYIHEKWYIRLLSEWLQIILLVVWHMLKQIKRKNNKRWSWRLRLRGSWNVKWWWLGGKDLVDKGWMLEEESIILN